MINQARKAIYTPVLIVGGGPVGLTLSLLLSKYGIRSRVLEKDTRLTDHPRAHFINTRTMEIYRSLGIAESIYSHVRPLNEWRKFIYCTSVIGEGNDVDIGETDHFSSTHFWQHSGFQHQKNSLYAELKKNSPCSVANLSQSKLTKILFKALESQQTQKKHGKKLGRVEFGMPVESITYGNNKVTTVTCVDKNNFDAKAVFNCKYLIGADGASSLVRQSLNIDLNGTPNMQYLINVHFHCPDLQYHLEGRHAMLYFVFNEQAVAVFIAHDIKSGEWVVQIPYFPPHQSPSDFTEEVCLKLIQDALTSETVVKDSLNIEIKSIKPWTMAGLVAEQFVNGRTAIIGDAAHQFPPSGGFGMNTGIQDAHNIAWKLSNIIKQENRACVSSDIEEKNIDASKLLHSYESERMPIANSNNSLSIYNFNCAMKIPEVLGLAPSYADLFSKSLAALPIGKVSKTLEKSIFDGVMSFGLKQLRVTGPSESNFIATKCKKRVKDILRSGDGLHLLFPAYELGFQYNAGAMAKPQNTKNHVDNGWSVDGAGPIRDADSNHNFLQYVPSTNPGARFPHINILKYTSGYGTDSSINTECQSSLDLFGNDDRFTVLFDLDNIDLATWASSLNQSSHYHAVGFTTNKDGVPMSMPGFECVVLKKDEIFDQVHPLLTDSLIFVRPDGHVADKYSGVPNVCAGRYIQSKIDIFLSRE